MEVKNVYEEEMEEEEDVKWVKHYSSMHQILLVGEGDFSFSLSLAIAFGSAINIVATSYDSYDVLLKKYSKAQSNVEELRRMGAAIIHQVDATKMKFHVDLRTRKFDRIVFNFPHAGFKGKEDHPQLIKLHRELVRGFFRSACRMLRPYGEVHVSHKTAVPFSHWNLEELAAESSLLRIECVDFCIEDYPGYSNKRGDGSRSDIPFPLGKCSTFKFIIGKLHIKKNPLRTDSLPRFPSISSSPVMVNHFSYGNIAADCRQYTDIIYPEMHFPVYSERIPRSITMLPPMANINGLEFRGSTLQPFSRIKPMHELQFSTYPGVSLGYSYSRHLEELHARRVSSLECGRMLVRQPEWYEETHQRRLFLCHGI